MLFSIHGRAEVTLRLDDGVSLHVVNGKAVSNQGLLSGKPVLTLEDGVHQIVIDYQAEIGRSRDESILETSGAFVIMFEAEDENLAVIAPDISTRRQMEAFNDNPEWVLRNAAGKSRDFHLDVLDKTGFQLVRDFEKEISEFNRGSSEAALNNVGSEADKDHAAAKPLPSGESVNDQEMVRRMLRYWYMKADENTKSEMKHWINSGD